MSIAGLSEHILGVVLCAEGRRSGVCQGGSVAQGSTVAQGASVAQGPCGNELRLGKRTSHDCAEDHLQQRGVRGVRLPTRCELCVRSYVLLRDVGPAGPVEIFAISRWHNPSGRTMALGSTQPLTEMSTRNILWGVKVAGA